jgi:hypothetical protein
LEVERDHTRRIERIMSKHTPGPWEVDGTKSLGAYGVWTAYGDHPGYDGSLFPSRICSVLDRDFPKNDDRERRDANARLIAAAPMLLDELKNIANADVSKWNPDTQHMFKEWAQARARDAIRKATGVQS